MNDLFVNISHTESDTGLLGPFRRFVVWVHGCCFDCPGCLAESTRFGEYSRVSAAGLAGMIVKSGCEGITVSGGEPFLQAPALAAAIYAVKQERDIGVIVYSGFTLGELQDRPDAAGLLDLTDVLIDGRYIRELDDGRPYIGSSNQRLIYLTDRYRAAGEEYYSGQKLRRCEIKLTGTKAVLIGVPSADTLHAWKEIRTLHCGGSQLINQQGK